jgi:hypothetical protein
MIHVSIALQSFIIDARFSSAALLKVLAYLDPGSGSYLLQLLIAAALGGLLLLRVYWSKVKTFVRRLFTGKGEDLDVDE